MVDTKDMVVVTSAEIKAAVAEATVAAAVLDMAQLLYSYYLFY